MMSGYEITCANKNRLGVIIRIGGAGWSLDGHEAIVKIMSGQLRLRIRVGGSYQDVGVRGEGMNAYLALEPDGFPLHELHDLPSC
jgi:hypothetical protein